MSERCPDHGEDEAPWMCACTRAKLSALTAEQDEWRAAYDELVRLLNARFPPKYGTQPSYAVEDVLKQNAELTAELADLRALTCPSCALCASLTEELDAARAALREAMEWIPVEGSQEAYEEHRVGVAVEISERWSKAAGEAK